MALKQCGECGNQVSDKAATCPNCGVKQPKKTSKLSLVFVGLLLVMIISGLLSETDNSQKVEPVKAEVENKAGIMLFYIQSKIKQNAKDPDSVQFRSEKIKNETDDGAVACGEYNAKNSFGAYTGFKGFVGVENTQTTYFQDGPNESDFVKYWNKHCT